MHLHHPVPHLQCPNMVGGVWGHIKKKIEVGGVQGGEDVQDGFSCRSLFAKEPLIIRPVCGRRPVKIRHPMHLYNPVGWYLTSRVGVEKSACCSV